MLVARYGFGCRDVGCPPDSVEHRYWTIANLGTSNVQFPASWVDSTLIRAVCHCRNRVAFG